MLPDFFELSISTRILYGAGIIDDLKEAVAEFGAKRAILVTDQVIMSLGIVDRVVASLNKTAITIQSVFTDVPADSTITTVENCAAQATAANCDLIIALGGGSVMDTAKVANILIVKGGRVADHMGAYLLGEAKLLPQIMIPTTSGTGSEVTKVAVIADPDNNVKLPFAENQICPQLAILDPELTQSMPPLLTASTGMDALTHAIEAYVSKESQPAVEAISLKVIKLVDQHLLRACQHPDDLEARGAMLIASCLGGVAISQSMVGIAHGIAHALGGVYHIPHGMANALVLPEAMNFNLDVCLDKYVEIAEALGIKIPMPIETSHTLIDLFRLKPLHKLASNFNFIDTGLKTFVAKQGINKIRLLNRRLATVASLPINLKAAGVKDNFTKMDLVVEKALIDGSLLYNPRDASQSDLTKILKKLYKQSPSPIKYVQSDLSTFKHKKSKMLEHVFDDEKMVYELLGKFMQQVVTDGELSNRLLKSKLIVQFVYEDPHAAITIDASQSPISITFGDECDKKIDVVMSMRADFAHEFWLGNASIVSALSKRQVKSKGDVSKAVRLLPIIKPAHAMYHAFLQSNGNSRLLH